MQNPKARSAGLLVDEVADELVILDEERTLVHRLNPAASVVWRHCDGQRSVADLAAILKEALGPQAGDDLVRVALDQLDAARLLAEPTRRTPDEARDSRRQAVRMLGRVGVVTLLLPAITTLALPTPAAAQSGGVGACISCSCYCICDKN